MPTGHEGAHDDGAGRVIGRRVTHELRELADAIERIGHHFGWTAPAVDRDLTGPPGTVANSPDALAILAASLDTILHRAARLAAHVRDAGASYEGPSWPTGSKNPEHLIALALLDRGGYCPPLPARSAP